MSCENDDSNNKSPSGAEVTDADSSFEIHSNDEVAHNSFGNDRHIQESAVTKEKERPRPPVVIDKINKAARTILDHNEAHKAWTNADYPEVPSVLNKINGPKHYITAAAKHDFLKKFQ